MRWTALTSFSNKKIVVNSEIVMPRKKRKKSQLDIIKSVRREMPPSGQTFQVKKNKPFRKRKHKGKIDTEG
jgi:hypothetical protein